jgi:hypothetical protein
LLTKTRIGLVEDSMRRVLFISAVLCWLTGTSLAQTPATATDHAPANAGPEIKNGADVQAAVNAACNGTNPGRVALPLGVLLVSATVSIPSRCSLLGAGLGRTVLRATNSFAPASPAALLSVAEKKDVALLNLTLDGNHPANAHMFTLLQIDSSTNVLIDNIHGMNSGNGVTVLHASSYVTIENSEVERCGVPLPSADGGGVGISPGASPLSHVRVADSRIHDNNQGISLFNSSVPGNNATDVSFIHNSVYSNADDGINVTSSGHPTGGSIIGLHVENNETYCNGWTPNPSGGPGRMGFSSECAPGFFQTGPDSPTGVGIDIVGPLTIQTTVVGNRTHDNLLDGISDDASLMIAVSITGKTIIWLSGPPFNRQWKFNQPVIIEGRYYHITSIANDGSTLSVSPTLGPNARTTLFGPSVVHNSFVGNISWNNATGIFNQMADGNSYVRNRSFHNALAGSYTNGGSYNEYTDDEAYSNGQNHAVANQGFAVNEGLSNRFHGIAADDPTPSPTQNYGISISTGSVDTLIENDHLIGTGGGRPVNNLAASTVWKKPKGPETKQ